MKKYITITGITSDSCIDKISKILFSIPEIESINIDLNTNIFEIELNDHISNDILKNAIKSAGKYEIIGIE